MAPTPIIPCRSVMSRPQRAPPHGLHMVRKLGDGIRKCSIKHVVGASGEEIIKPLLPPVQG
uniref:Uncharacterized protein n=1 Tax=Oryza barthii TaxID=65489 RepID=A0A0D3GL37_9ORYZ